MPNIVTEIDIARPSEEVFAFATTPANWPLVASLLAFRSGRG
jgi:hypothetical protein